MADLSKQEHKTQALKWLKLAADQDYCDAKYQLSILVYIVSSDQKLESLASYNKQNRHAKDIFSFNVR